MKRTALFALLPVALLAVALYCGCDDGGAEEGDVFRIDPSNPTLTVETGAIALTAVGGEEPFTWSANDAGLGAVTGTARTVTYTRTAAVGANTVRCVDNQQWVATTVITQPDVDAVVQTLTIAANPTRLTVADERSVVTVAGGTAPYRWSVADVTLGNLLPGNETAASRVYVRNRAGDNSITVRDSAGNVVHIIISQP
jgi:hypothetical protein